VKVLVIPEDPTHDQYILRPILERIFRDLSRPVHVDILRDPHLRGVDQALSQEEVAAIVADNPMIDLFLIMVDRDCNRQRNCERAAARENEHSCLLTCLAIEEVEIWMLALHHDQLEASWKDVRGDCDPKEGHADPFLRAKGWTTKIGQGRKHAMRELGRNWNTLQSLCPELRELKERIRNWLVDHAGARS
jgi:hypothetical protein